MAAILDGTGWVTRRMLDDDGGRYVAIIEKDI